MKRNVLYAAGVTLGAVALTGLMTGTASAAPTVESAAFAQHLQPGNAAPALSAGQYSAAFSRNAASGQTLVQMRLPSSYHLTQSGNAIAFSDGSSAPSLMQSSGGQYGGLSSTADRQPGVTLWRFTYSPVTSGGVAPSLAAKLSDGNDNGKGKGDGDNKGQKEPYYQHCANSMAKGFATGAVDGCIVTAEVACAGAQSGMWVG